ncbi:grlR [Symbiodinium necroappetens]|uniref:Probable pectate lyase C n=1 Tax=Symbiodinium necroappetens TaxID=1628268 RepID=A0A812MFR9_9DINO|nr:grlR [Symbiodinium necroappetens]
MSVRITAAAFACSFGFALVSHGGIILVDDDMPADFSTIQAAIDAATDGQIIIVAPGTYTENLFINGKSLEITSTDPTDPTVVAMTVIDAGGAGNGIIFISPDGTHSTDISGMTVRNGAAFSGAGIACSNVTLRLFDMVIENCVSTSFGGGFFSSVGSNVSMFDCRFDSCEAPMGGGLLVNDSDLVIADSTFAGGIATDEGGAMSIVNTSTAIIQSCDFENNDAFVGGAIFVSEDSMASAILCDFLENNAFGAGGAVRYETGVPVLDAPITIENSVFTSNTASSGGAVSFSGEAAPEITGCGFTGNSSTSGGGAVSNTLGASTVISGCTFMSNTAPGDGGGAIDNFDAGGVRVTGCSFTLNGAFRGGAISNTSFSDIIVTDCSFDMNGATNSGGAIYNSESAPVVTGCGFTQNSALGGGAVTNIFSSDPVFRGCTLTNNSAGLRGGGAFSTDNCVVRFEACRFTGNFAPEGGGLYNSQFSSPIIINSLFDVNTADAEGGAIHNDGASDPEIINSTFVANSAMSDGGAIFSNFNSSPIAVNSIFWNNTPNEINGGNPTVSTSLVDGGFPGVMIIALNPAFVDEIGGDYRLDGASPALDLGDVTALPMGVTEDLDGNARVVGVGLDLGAYERQGDTPCPGDCDGSGTVDFNDLVAMLFEFGNATPPCDADESGTVDFNDLVAALFLFGPCP